MENRTIGTRGSRQGGFTALALASLVISPVWTDPIVFGTMVAFLVFRPQGLFPVRQQLLAYGKSARRLLGAADDSKAAA